MSMPDALTGVIEELARLRWCYYGHRNRWQAVGIVQRLESTSVFRDGQQFRQIGMTHRFNEMLTEAS